MKRKKGSKLFLNWLIASLILFSLPNDLNRINQIDWIDPTTLWRIDMLTHRRIFVWSHQRFQLANPKERVLVTLDLEFGNPLRFKPSQYAGIIVLRLSSRPAMSDLLDSIRTLVGGLKKERVHGELWIVQKGRIRIFQEEQTRGL